jgi:uncharacterized membrane protein
VPEALQNIMKEKLLKPGAVALTIGTSILILFVCSSLRHAMFQSGAFDLGIYDQVVYLISQGQPPISSILGFHHMGNHAAWAVYLLALFYKIFPNVHWLLIVQAVALSLGALPMWHLAHQAGLKQSQSVAMAAAYLLYPLIFNVNLFEFHPEVMAVPVFLAAVWCARESKIGWFCLSIIFILGCKAVLSLTVAAIGFLAAGVREETFLWCFCPLRWYYLVPHCNSGGYSVLQQQRSRSSGTLQLSRQFSFGHCEKFSI